jgi:hypothetical protein
MLGARPPSPRSHEYGARPVSVDIARGRLLIPHPKSGHPQLAPVLSLPLTHSVVADQLALAHWSPGHRIVVCSLAGGTGRTTLAGLMASILAELPYAHVWRPIGLVEVSPRTLASTERRWGATGAGPSNPDASTDCLRVTAAGAHVLADTQLRHGHGNNSAVLVDAPVGMPSDHALIQEDATASVVLVCRPDRTSLAEAAEALVWMHDQDLLTRDRVNVVVNCGAGPSSRGSAAAATALGIRSASVHSLSFDKTLGPGRTLPSGRAIPTPIRRCITRLCLDVWAATKSQLHSTTNRSTQHEERA